jgi:hypothetical protein
LVLDGHSGAPIKHGAVSVLHAQFGGKLDTMGVARVHLPRSGEFPVRVFGIGYEPWSGTVMISDTAGCAVVVQLRRSYAAYVHVIPTDTSPQLPNER